MVSKIYHSGPKPSLPPPLIRLCWLRDRRVRRSCDTCPSMTTSTRRVARPREITFNIRDLYSVLIYRQIHRYLQPTSRPRRARCYRQLERLETGKNRRVAIQELASSTAGNIVRVLSSQCIIYDERCEKRKIRLG